MKKITTKTLLFSSFLLAIIFAVGCNKSSDTAGDLPTVSTSTTVSSLTGSSAQVYVIVNSIGGTSLTSVGVCWSATNQTPTTADSKTTNSVDTAYFAAKIAGLSANTTYYARAYAGNAAGVSYGNTITFKTNSATFAVNATVSTFSGTGVAGYVDGAPTLSQYAYPLGVCADSQGNIYVADFYNNVIRKITAAGVSSTYAGNGTLGYVDGPAATAQFNTPQGIAIDAAGNLYVTDMGNNLIRKISTAGVVSTLAGRGYAGYADGTGTSAVFKLPSGIAVDAAGNAYVADRGNNMIRMITPAGVVTTLAGSTTAGQIDATGTAAEFNNPVGVAVDSKGIVYVTDLANYSLRSVTPAGVVTTMLGSSLINTILGAPWGICLDSSGNIFMTDANGRILQLNAAHVLYPLAGISGTAGFTNGLNTAALFNSPRAICVDASGNLYVSEYSNHVIRKIKVVTTP